MTYVYPKLSDKDYFLFRAGGAGLGNILFTYARAMIYAKRNNYCLIWPTWPSIKVGPILRRERDKRFYFDLFRNNSRYIGGIRKILLLATKKKITEKDARSGMNVEDKIIIFSGFEGCFDDIFDDYKMVYEDLKNNLASKNRLSLSFDAGNTICLHVRLGDFSRATTQDLLKGKHCSAIPVEWYAEMVKEIRHIVNDDIKAYVFSDETENELAPLLELPNVERITFGTAIADIMALANAGIFVASGSSFSMWARYLGRMTTVIFPNQIKQSILSDDEFGKEIIALDKIPEEYYTAIRKAVTK